MIKPESIGEEITSDSKPLLASETGTEEIRTRCNDYSVKLSGYNREELIGRPLSIVKNLRIFQYSTSKLF